MRSVEVLFENHLLLANKLIELYYQDYKVIKVINGSNFIVTLIL